MDTQKKEDAISPYYLDKGKYKLKQAVVFDHIMSEQFYLRVMELYNAKHGNTEEGFFTAVARAGRKPQLHKRQPNVVDKTVDSDPHIVQFTSVQANVTAISDSSSDDSLHKSIECLGGKMTSLLSDDIQRTANTVLKRTRTQRAESSAVGSQVRLVTFF